MRGTNLIIFLIAIFILSSISDYIRKQQKAQREQQSKPSDHTPIDFGQKHPKDIETPKPKTKPQTGKKPTTEELYEEEDFFAKYDKLFDED